MTRLAVFVVFMALAGALLVGAGFIGAVFMFATMTDVFE